MTTDNSDQMAGEVRALHVALDGRILPEDNRLIAEFIGHDEHGGAVEWMAAALAARDAEVSSEERVHFRRLADALGGLELPTDVT